MLLNSLFKHWSYRIFAPGTILREKYEALKHLLHHDIRCHEQMAEFQDMLHEGCPEDLAAIRKRFAEFSSHVRGMVDALETMAPGSYLSLGSYHKKFDFYTRFLLAPPKLDFSPPYVLDLEKVTATHKGIGNKAKNIALVCNEIGLPIPRGFVITVSAFHYLIEYNNLRDTIDALLAEIHIHDTRSLGTIAEKLQQLIRDAEIPPAIAEEIQDACSQPLPAGQPAVGYAVRSSAISEDGAFSFAGQYLTVLDTPAEEIDAAYLEVLASKYTPEALFYRISHGLGDEETAMSVLVQEMVEARCSGVVYTSDHPTDDSQADLLHLHVIEGQGDRLVSGRATPKIYSFSKGEKPSLLPPSPNDQQLNPDQALTIAQMGVQIESYFDCPQDIEWAMAQDETILLLQARPLHPEQADPSALEWDLSGLELYLDDCRRASTGIGSGPVYKVDEDHPLDNIPHGSVLVVRDASPDYVRIMNRLAAVLAERGSRASHFATVAREFGVPFLTSIPDCCTRFDQENPVTVDAIHGAVYKGLLDTSNRENPVRRYQDKYHRILRQALKFITPLELVDPTDENFIPEGCRSMHDIIRFCHEKAVLSMFTAGRPGSGRGALRLEADIPLDVFLFDVGGGFSTEPGKKQVVPLQQVASLPFQALWKGLSHPGVQWKQKPFDWEAYDKIELAGGVPPKKDSFAFASYAVIGTDYLHFNIRFGYHFTIVDVLCGENSAENHCMLRFAGGGGDYDQRMLRIDFIAGVLERLEFQIDKKGDLLEAKLPNLKSEVLTRKLDMLGRLLGATKLMDMVLTDQQMVADYVEDFYKGRYSFSQQG